MPHVLFSYSSLSAFPCDEARSLFPPLLSPSSWVAVSMLSQSEAQETSAYLPLSRSLALSLLRCLLDKLSGVTKHGQRKKETKGDTYANTEIFTLAQARFPAHFDICLLSFSLSLFVCRNLYECVCMNIRMHEYVRISMCLYTNLYFCLTPLSVPCCTLRDLNSCMRAWYLSAIFSLLLLSCLRS